MGCGRRSLRRGGNGLRIEVAKFSHLGTFSIFRLFYRNLFNNKRLALQWLRHLHLPLAMLPTRGNPTMAVKFADLKQMEISDGE